MPSGGPTTLRNTGVVPLAYIVEPMGYGGGVVYTPGVPTSEPGEVVGVLAPGATIDLPSLTNQGDLIALLGASTPFSTYDGGYAAQDEWSIPWPMGVSGSEGSATMYVAEAEWDATCQPVYRP